MKCLDSIKLTLTNESSQPTALHDTNILLTSSSTEYYLENCGYIIQWLYLTTLNRIKPVCYSIAHDSSIIHWYMDSSSKSSANTTSYNTTNKDVSTTKTLGTLFEPTTITSPRINTNVPAPNRSIQQLTVTTLIKMKESLEAA
jgi:hypothetical protein